MYKFIMVQLNWISYKSCCWKNLPYSTLISFYTTSVVWFVMKLQVWDCVKAWISLQTWRMIERWKLQQAANVLETLSAFEKRGMSSRHQFWKQTPSPFYNSQSDSASQEPCFLLSGMLECMNPWFNISPSAASPSWKCPTICNSSEWHQTSSQFSFKLALDFIQIRLCLEQNRI